MSFPHNSENSMSSASSPYPHPHLTQSQPQRETRNRLLFPPFFKNSNNDWRAVDDRVRGGHSVSHLDLYSYPHKSPSTSSLSSGLVSADGTPTRGHTPYSTGGEGAGEEGEENSLHASTASLISGSSLTWTSGDEESSSVDLGLGSGARAAVPSSPSTGSGWVRVRPDAGQLKKVASSGSDDQDENQEGRCTLLRPSPDNANNEGQEAVRFWGNLDTQALGVAGFASQAREYGSSPSERLQLPKSLYSGLRIRYLSPASRPIQDEITSEKENASEKDHDDEKGSDRKPIPLPTKYTIVLKTSSPIMRPDGRRESALSWEYTFDTSLEGKDRQSSNVSGSGWMKVRVVDIPWDSLQPTFRGRRIPETDDKYEPFIPGQEDSTSPISSSSSFATSLSFMGDEYRQNDVRAESQQNQGITELSLMCRSNFLQQEGPFELIVSSIEALPESHVYSPLAASYFQNFDENHDPEAGVDGENPHGRPFHADNWFQRFCSGFASFFNLLEEAFGKAVESLDSAWRRICSWFADGGRGGEGDDDKGGASRAGGSIRLD